jgi:hypothetical protein
MSAAQHDPAATKSPPAVGAHHLDTLQGMLNLIYLSSGRFLREVQSGGGTGRMKQEMKRAAPIASERFHDALDQLENEVRQAQLVLRRDLALRKQDRKKRELAAREKEAEKVRLAAEVHVSGGTNIEPKVEKVSTPTPTPLEPTPQPEPELPLKREADPVLAPIETSAASPPSTERDPLFDATPTTAIPADHEFDFDAIFGDAMDTSGDAAAGDDVMDTSGDMGFNFDEGPSLLHGLEDFAKESEDAEADVDVTMPDLPDLDLADEKEDVKVEPPAPIKAATPPAAPAAPQPVAVVEEVKAEEPVKIDTANDDLMGDMVTTDNLDDLFNMDEYENPEQSSFDDAFFNFDN